MNDYFEKELNIPVYHEPMEFTFNDQVFFIGHGDGLGPGDNGFKRMKKVFTNPIAKWFFRWLHPDLGVKLAQYFSVKNRLISGEEDVKFLGEEKEWPLTIDLKENSKYINLGDWISFYTYGVFDGEKLELKEF